MNDCDKICAKFPRKFLTRFWPKRPQGSNQIGPPKKRKIPLLQAVNFYLFLVGPPDAQTSPTKALIRGPEFRPSLVTYFSSKSTSKADFWPKPSKWPFLTPRCPPFLPYFSKSSCREEEIPPFGALWKPAKSVQVSFCPEIDQNDPQIGRK